MAFVACGAGVFALSQLTTAHAASDKVFSDVPAVPERPVALVLGAGLYPDGSPTPMLADRVAGAVALYRNGTVGQLLLSGDNSTANYDEPTTMRRLALNAGVPAAAITLDYAGFSTFESCARATRIFGVQAAIVVTQDFHAARAVQLCRASGIDTVAFAQSSATYSNSSVEMLRMRERLASVKSLWSALLRPDPTFLGAFEGLPGSEQLPPGNQLWDDHLTLS